MKPERKLYQDFKKASPKIIYNRIENLSLIGMPDALCYNKNNIFFTVEFKVTRGKKIRFSPHQISFHVKHPKNSFILVEALDPRSAKHVGYRLYPGSGITALGTFGLKLEALCLTLEACDLFFNKLGA